MWLMITADLLKTKVNFTTMFIKIYFWFYELIVIIASVCVHGIK